MRVWFAAYSWALIVLWTGCLGAAFAGWLLLLGDAFERRSAPRPAATALRGDAFRLAQPREARETSDPARAAASP